MGAERNTGDSKDLEGSDVWEDDSDVGMLMRSDSYDDEEGDPWGGCCR